ncbi:MAG: hypothetical protein R2792_03805 [Saprospiraceae bacterium]
MTPNDPFFSTIIGEQVHAGNEWLGTAGAWQAFNESDNLNDINNSKFLSEPALFHNGVQEIWA